MPTPEPLWRWFDNASLAAFIGAGAAYLLVVINDRRRARRFARRIVPAELSRIQTLIASRIEGVERARESLNTETHISDIGQRFAVALLRQYAERTVDTLPPVRINAIYDIAFQLEEADPAERSGAIPTE
jgi:hypothetical protein